MKLPHFLSCALALVLLTSCNVTSSQPGNTNPLTLTLEITPQEVYAIEDIQGQIVLSNQGDSDLLVHRRLHLLPFPAPTAASEVYLMLSDSSGNLIYDKYYSPRYDWPSEDTLSVIKPEEQIRKKIYLYLGFYMDMFKKGETYTIVVVYQNDIVATQTIDGVEVSSWVGSIRSNEETFTILP